MYQFTVHVCRYFVCTHVYVQILKIVQTTDEGRRTLVSRPSYSVKRPGATEVDILFLQFNPLGIQEKV